MSNKRGDSPLLVISCSAERVLAAGGVLTYGGTHMLICRPTSVKIWDGMPTMREK